MRISDWSSDVCSSDLAPLSSGAKSSKRLKDHRGRRSYAARFQETRLRQVQAAEPLRLGRPAERAASLLLLRDGHDGGAYLLALRRLGHLLERGRPLQPRPLAPGAGVHSPPHTPPRPPPPPFPPHLHRR